MEVDPVTPPMTEAPAPRDGADLVVGILAELDQDGLLTCCEGLRALPGSPRVLVVHGATPDRAAASGSPVSENSPVSVLSWSAIGANLSAAAVQSIPDACEAIYGALDRLGAKACCVISSRMKIGTFQWICELIQPLLEAPCDLVVPYYAPGKLQGLLNNSIVYPLMRCLYGKRIHNPLGPDVGVSRRLAQKILSANRNHKAGSRRFHPLAALVPAAVCDSLSICQVYLGARHYPPTNWMNMGSVMSQVLGPIFAEMERTASCWQHTRGSAAVPARGDHRPVPPDEIELDLNRMVETFQLGVRDLQEIWGLVLPPATLLELRKLSRLTPSQVRMPDDLWARIVYDFALAHRLRAVNSDHLLASITPLYLAWVSSFVTEMAAAGASASIESRIERLSIAYEAAKPYLVSRWRWPDRFNP
jgi:glucosylglycerate synthase